jgi:hypothetical protein
MLQHYTCSSKTFTSAKRPHGRIEHQFASEANGFIGANRTDLSNFSLKYQEAGSIPVQPRRSLGKCLSMTT